MNEDRRCFRYRLIDGEVEARMFDNPDIVPDDEGWTDSPANLDNGAPPKAEVSPEPETKPKAPRKKKSAE